MGHPGFVLLSPQKDEVCQRAYQLIFHLPSRLLDPGSAGSAWGIDYLELQKKRSWKTLTSMERSYMAFNPFGPCVSVNYRDGGVRSCFFVSLSIFQGFDIYLHTHATRT